MNAQANSRRLFLWHLGCFKIWWVWWQILANLFESQPWNQWMMQASHDATNDASVMYESTWSIFLDTSPKTIVENKWQPAGTSWRCSKLPEIIATLLRNVIWEFQSEQTTPSLCRIPRTPCHFLGPGSHWPSLASHHPFLQIPPRT